MKGFNGIANAGISLCGPENSECVDRLTGLRWVQRDPARRDTSVKPTPSPPARPPARPPRVHRAAGGAGEGEREPKVAGAPSKRACK